MREVGEDKEGKVEKGGKGKSEGLQEPWGGEGERNGKEPRRGRKGKIEVFRAQVTHP